MSIKHHNLKCETEYFQAVESGKKRFEIRNNDRDFKKHDIVYLKEYVNGGYTGRELQRGINYIFYGGKFGLDKGYCIFNW